MLSLRDLGAAIVTAAGCGAWWGVGKFSAWLSASTPASAAVFGPADDLDASQRAALWALKERLKLFIVVNYKKKKIPI